MVSGGYRGYTGLRPRSLSLHRCALSQKLKHRSAGAQVQEGASRGASDILGEP